MPTIREYKVALKGASIAYLAGAHGITEAVWQNHSGQLSGEKRDSAVKTLQKGLKNFATNIEAVQALADFLNEEALYPFGDEWPAESLGVLMATLKVPVLNGDDAFENPLEFKFKKGFHKGLIDEARKRYASTDEDAEIGMSQLDHWLNLILSGAFHAGAITATRLSKNTQAFHSALTALEQESEPWARYPQLGAMYDAEMERDDGSDQDEGDRRRERDFGDDDDEGDDDDDERRGFGYDDEYGED